MALMMMTLFLVLSMMEILMAMLLREVFGVHQDGEEPVHCVKFSPDGSMLALGSRDNAIYTYQVDTVPMMYILLGWAAITMSIIIIINTAMVQVKENYRKYSRLGRCLGHSSNVIQLDWSMDCQHIRSNSADHEVVFFAITVVVIVIIVFIIIVIVVMVHTRSNSMDREAIFLDAIIIVILTTYHYNQDCQCYLHYHGDDFEKTQVMFWSTAVCRPVRDIEVLRDLQVCVIIIILITIIRYVSMTQCVITIIPICFLYHHHLLKPSVDNRPLSPQFCFHAQSPHQNNHHHTHSLHLH